MWPMYFFLSTHHRWHLQYILYLSSVSIWKPVIYIFSISWSLISIYKVTPKQRCFQDPVSAFEVKKYCIVKIILCKNKNLNNKRNMLCYYEGKIVTWYHSQDLGSWASWAWGTRLHLNLTPWEGFYQKLDRVLCNNITSLLSCQIL